MSDFYSFNENGDECVLKSMPPVREWENAHISGVCDMQYFSYCTNTGGGWSFARDMDGNINQIMADKQVKTVYLRNDQTNDLWSIAGAPIPKKVEDYQCSFKPAETKLSSVYDGIFASQRVFVGQGKAYEIWTIELENRSDKKRKISVFPYAEIQLTGYSGYYAKWHMHTYVDYIEKCNGLFAQNNNPSAVKGVYNAMMISSEKVSGVLGDREVFHQPSYNVANPKIATGWNPGFEEGRGYWPAFLLRNEVELAPGEKKKIHYAFGHARDINQVNDAHQLICDDDKVETLLDEVRQREVNYASTLSVDTGQKEYDIFFNKWIKKQFLSYLVFKNGFRDNLQVDMSLAMVDSAVAGENILRALSYQYEDGHAPHYYSPLKEQQFSDKPTWIPMVVAKYIKESGDKDFLSKKILYIVPGGEKAEKDGTVWEHVQKAIAFLKDDVGPHGLSLHHHADWNDALDGPGIGGPGESVMVTMQYCFALLETAKLARWIGQNDYANECMGIYEDFKNRINENAWDGKWYLRGFAGDGQLIGSHTNEEGQIFLNVQSWAIIAGIADEEKTASMMAAVDSRLECEIGMKISDPYYSKFWPHIGRMSVDPAGFAENGVYNHAGSFKIMADAIAGRNEAAWRTMIKILPNNPDNPMAKSGLEPFVIPNSYRCYNAREGQACGTWHTGTTAWVYMGYIEHILGIRSDYDGLVIDPCLPGHIKNVSITRKFRGCEYKISIDNTSGKCKGVSSLAVDGKEIEGNFVEMCSSKNCEIKVVV